MNIETIQRIPLIMTTDEAADILRCDPSTVSGYVHRHDLTAIQVGKERRIRAEDLLDFISRRTPTNKAK